MHLYECQVTRSLNLKKLFLLLGFPLIHSSNKSAAKKVTQKYGHWNYYWWAWKRENFFLHCLSQNWSEYVQQWNLFIVLVKWSFGTAWNFMPRILNFSKKKLIESDIHNNVTKLWICVWWILKFLGATQWNFNLTFIKLKPQKKSTPILISCGC